MISLGDDSDVVLVYSRGDIGANNRYGIHSLHSFNLFF